MAPIDISLNYGIGYFVHIVHSDLDNTFDWMVVSHSILFFHNFVQRHEYEYCAYVHSVSGSDVLEYWHAVLWLASHKAATFISQTIEELILRLLAYEGFLQIVWCRSYMPQKLNFQVAISP